MTMTQPKNLDELKTLVASGTRPRYLFFWGHTAKRPEAVGAECLSQWYGAPFQVDGATYPTAEHYMMAAKARLFGDTEREAEVYEAPSPGAAKAIGRRVRGFRDDVWKRERMGIVIRANLAKFEAHEELGTFLISTKNRVLVEASPRDRIWGIGLSAANPKAENPRTWRGQNLLGFALMEVRQQLAC